MGAIRYSNNASGTLAISLAPGDASITLGAGQGSAFPAIGPGQYALVTLEDSSGVIEIVKAITRTGDVMNIERAQEGTLAAAFASGSRVEVRVTAASLNNFLQKAGDTMPGIYDATGGQFKNGQLINMPMRGEPGISTNEIKVPPGGAAPTIGGNTIYHTGNLTPAAIMNLIFPVGTIIMFKGVIGNIPVGFQLCDGTNGTPDLRGKFVIGAGGDYTVDSIGGGTDFVTAAGGGHTPVIKPTELSVDMLPAHAHRLWVQWSGGAGDTEPINNYGAALAGNTDGTKAWASMNGSNQPLVENTGNTGAASAHTHTADAVPEHTHTVTAALPPYRGLFYIMKV